MENLIIKVRGMSCQSCVRSLTAALTSLPGVQSAEVSLEAGEARVQCDPAQTSRAALKEAVEDAGFDTD